MEKAKSRLTSDSFLEFSLIILITAAIVLIDNLFNSWAGSRSSGAFKWLETFAASIPGVLILLGIAWVGTVLGSFIPKIPSVIWITVIGILLAMPYSPTGAYVTAATTKINMLACSCPILAYAGISMGKDWAEFKKIGWRGILIALLVMFGTFIGSALIAEIILKVQGII